MKYVYRVLILSGIFLCSVFLFGMQVTKQSVDNRETVKMGDATHPLVEIETLQKTINLMHGYTGNLNVSNFRENIVPVDSTQAFSIIVKENSSEVKKIIYSISEVKSGTVIESGAVSALTQLKDGKSIKVKVREELQAGHEYALSITAVTSTSKKIHFFTRIKRVDNSHLKEKLDFVTSFHDATFNKEKFKEFIPYLNMTPSNDESTLADVTIESPSELITWGNYKPKIITNVIPTIKEINSETMSVELAYSVEMNKKTYSVREFFRVKYDGRKFYLLAYERHMNNYFSLEDVDFTSKKINIGIADKSPDVAVSDDGNKMCFTANGSLWFYDMDDNKAYSVFSFLDEDKDYAREGYEQHDIRILNIKDNGEVNFLVYGYMNRGDYEGKLGIILYRFYQKEDRIEEMLFIPYESGFEIMEKNLDQFSYLSGQDIYYFSMNNVIYAYNIITKARQEIATNVSKNSFILSETGNFIAWQNSNHIKESTMITMLNLETGEKKEIKAPADSNIRVLGTVDINLIYGFVKKSDISTNSDGSVVAPMYSLELMSNLGKVVLKYHEANCYTTKVKVNDNVVELTRVKKAGSGYEKTKADYIMSGMKKVFNYIKVTEVDNGKHINETVIELPENLKIKKNPTITTAKNTVVTVDTVLHLVDTETTSKRFYVYAIGHIQGAYDVAGDAIAKADPLMGVVIDQSGNVIWERGELNYTGTAANVTKQYATAGVNAKGAVLAMVLKGTGLSADAANLSNESGSIYSILNKRLKNSAVNLTGATLEEVLYYVSKGRSVIAFKDNKQPVLITKYDSYNNITFIDPSAHTEKKMGKTAASDYFEKAGNIFISYIN